MGKLHTRFYNKGFTLVELLVVCAILGILIGITLVILNPIKQLNKAHDAQRKQDFVQIRHALDLYYDDHNCYPTTLPFGQSFTENQTVYMKKVPQDSSCGNNNGICYQYTADTTNSCPQWFVLFGKLAEKSNNTFASCPLATSCMPADLVTKGYSLCTFGGSYDCAFLQTVTPVTSVTPNIANTPIPGSTSNATATPVSTVNATATPVPTVNNPLYRYSCIGGACNDVGPGNGQYTTSSCNNVCF